MGLYLNDLNPHGLSREMVLAGWQHCSRYVHTCPYHMLQHSKKDDTFNFCHFSIRIELMFEKEEQRSDELETSLKLADSWKRQGDDLLYSMIPRPVADKMRAGQNTLSTCQSFEEVSVLFAEVEVSTYYYKQTFFFWIEILTFFSIENRIIALLVLMAALLYKMQ